MEVTKELRTEREKARIAQQKARNTAIRTYFAAGDGALDRRCQFAEMALRRAFTWTVISGAFISFGVIAMLTFGIGHEQALTELHTWMTATPVEQVIEKVHSIFLDQLLNCLIFGVSVGIFLTLVRVSEPEPGQSHE